MGVKEVELETRPTDAMVGGTGAAGPAADLRNQRTETQTGDLRVDYRNNNIVLSCAKAGSSTSTLNTHQPGTRIQEPLCRFGQGQVNLVFQVEVLEDEFWSSWMTIINQRILEQGKHAACRGMPLLASEDCFHNTDSRRSVQVKAGEQFDNP